MKPSRRRKLWLALPAFLLCLFDQVATLVGQGREYWAGDFSQVSEGAPHGHWLLSQHPAAYITAACFYLVGIVLVIAWLPRLLARMVSAGLVIGHTWGTCHWIWMFQEPYRDRAYWSCIALFVFSGCLLVVAFDKSEGACVTPGA